MGSVMLRILGILATLLGIIAGASRASAQPVAHGMPGGTTAAFVVRLAP